MPKYPRFDSMSIVTGDGGASGSSVGGGRSASGSYAYPTLTSTNYMSWVIHVQAIMKDHGVWEVIKL